MNYNSTQQTSYKETPFRRRTGRVGKYLYTTMSEITHKEYEKPEQRIRHAREIRLIRRHSEVGSVAPEAQTDRFSHAFNICVQTIFSVVYLTMLFGILVFVYADEFSYVGDTFQPIRLLIESLRKELQLYKDLEKLTQNVCNHHMPDHNGMTDYALKSSGATVITSSPSYRPKRCNNYPYAFNIWCKNNPPETVIQPKMFIGKCWGFKGSQGYLVISLSHPVRITHITLDHLPRVFSPDAYIQSAPKDFSVFGMTNKEGKDEYLGKFTFDLYGESSQTFKIMDAPSEVYSLVMLRVLSNWGHHKYTCVYRFRVHSQQKTEEAGLNKSNN